MFPQLKIKVEKISNKIFTAVELWLLKNKHKSNKNSLNELFFIFSTTNMHF